MALAGLPQFMAQRYVLYSGTYGGTNEVDCAATNNFDNTGIFSGNASKTITGGNQGTVGPIIAEVNGVVWAIPYGVAATIPNEVYNSLNPVTLTASQTAITASIWNIA